jgi:hypothetical protein
MMQMFQNMVYLLLLTKGSIYAFVQNKNKKHHRTVMQNPTMLERSIIIFVNNSNPSAA